MGYGRTKEYKKKYYENNKKKLQKISSEKRLIRRRMVQDKWGRLGGTKEKELWVLAELKAQEHLSKVGVKNIHHLSDLFPFFPFDLVGEIDGVKTLFQVTVRTHVDGAKRHKEMASLLGMQYKIIYVKPDFSFFVITESTELGVMHLKGEVL